MMTRSAAANLLGLNDRGHLAPGAIADIAIYDPKHVNGQSTTDYQTMFSDVALLFKSGQLVVKDGAVINRLSGMAQTISPVYDSHITRTVQNYFDRFYSLKLSNYAVQEADFDYLEHPRFRGIATVG